MASSLQDPDYKNNFFQHPELILIHGEPTTAALIILRNEVKANTMTVFTTLGGGARGHLGLVVDAPTYTTIPDTQPYIRPVHPGPLVLAQNVTQYQIVLTRDQHQENMRLFREANAVERALIQQIVAAIDAKFVRAIRDNHTGMLIGTIPDIFDSQLVLRNTGQLTVRESMNQAEIVNLVSEGVRQALAENTVPENEDSLQEQVNSVQANDRM